MLTGMGFQARLIKVLLYRLLRGNRNLPTACCKEARASFPLPPTGQHGSERAAAADLLAASRDWKHSWWDTQRGVYQVRQEIVRLVTIETTSLKHT
jgi:hypothetical protein